MKNRYVVDTNVLIAASAADPGHTRAIDATPDDPALQLQVWQWLQAFETSPTRLVLDAEGKIFDEYQHKLGFNDYGLQVIMQKWSTVAVDTVGLSYDADGHAELPTELARVVHDLADRKMVAAALQAYHDFGEGCVAFAGDTDWHDWEATLLTHHVLLEPIIEAWSRQKHREKQKPLAKHKHRSP